MYPDPRVVNLKFGLVATDCYLMGSTIDRDGDLLARVARIGEGKLGLQFVASGTRLALHPERNQVSAWDAYRRSRGSWGWCRTRNWLLVGEGILLGWPLMVTRPSAHEVTCLVASQSHSRSHPHTPVER